MRPLFVYKYLTLGGVETVLRARLDALAAHGIEAHAWFFHDLGGRPVFSGCEDRVHVGPPEDCVAAACNGFDVVCTIDTEEVLEGFADRTARPAVVVECHSPYLQNLEYLRRLPADTVAAVWTPSLWQRGVALERLNLHVPVQVVPNPLRDGFIREPVPFPAPPPEPILAWLGRLDELKNWRGFLRLGRRLSGQPHELWLIGRGVDRMAQEVLEEAQSQQVVERLRWFAGVDHKFLPNLLDAVRDSGGVFVSTSRGESFGMAVAEAMARGCAVAVPDNPPFNELVEHGVTGLRYADERAASGAVGRLLRDSSLRDGCGRRARAWVVEQFAPAKVTAILTGALRAAAGGGDGST